MGEQHMVVRNGVVSWRDAPRRRPATRPRADAGSHRPARHLNPPTITKEEATCCMAQVDDLGRPPIGFCGPSCERRVERDARLGVS